MGRSARPDRSRQLYTQPAAGGHAWAQYNLGHLYLDGIGVVRDRCRAYRYYLEAASQQHARAMNLLGRCCEQGWGAPRDPVAAAQWYRRSAEGGYFRGQYNWAAVLLNCQRDEEAVVWLERAARGGTPAVRQAVINLATLFTGVNGLSALVERLGAEDVGQSDRMR